MGWFTKEDIMTHIEDRLTKVCKTTTVDKLITGITTVGKEPMPNKIMATPIKNNQKRVK